jgi:peroxiredoxin
MLKPGDQAAPFQASLLDGGQIQVEFSSGQRWILLYFSPRCRYSYEQFPYWRGLIENGQASNLNVVGLVSEHEDPQQVTSFLQSMGAASLPVARIADEVHRRYKLLVTPLTLTLDGQGKVEKKWIGRWGFSTMQEVAQMLKLD